MKSVPYIDFEVFKKESSKVKTPDLDWVKSGWWKWKVGVITKVADHYQNVNDIFKIVIMKSEGVDFFGRGKKVLPRSRKRFDVVLESVGVIEKNSGLGKKYHLDLEIKKVHALDIQKISPLSFKKQQNPHFHP